MSKRVACDDVLIALFILLMYKRIKKKNNKSCQFARTVEITKPEFRRSRLKTVASPL